jgi:adenine-specific DNA-methyltransferase
VTNLKGRQDRKHIATAHEHVLMFEMPEGETFGFPLSDDRKASFDSADEAGHAYELRDLRRRGGGDRREDRPNMFFPIFWNQATRKASLQRTSKDEIEIVPKRSDGSDGRWRWGPERVQQNLAILEAKPSPDDGRWNVDYRVYLDKDGERRTKPKSIWLEPRYSTDHAGKTLKGMIPGCNFPAPKAVGLLQDILCHSLDEADLACDYFAGSGTTGHAIIALNRMEGSERRFLLVEMGQYFKSVLLPRLLKAAFSSEWEDGKPQKADAVSLALKYFRLESYEDALNNLELKRTDKQEMFLDADAEMREQYILSYMLDVESRGSQSLLNVEAFRNPDEYKLRVERNGETQLVNVDLVETFNWLLGLTVKHIDVIRGVRVVEGKAPNGDRVLVLWRNIDKLDNDALDKWFQKQDYNTREMVYDVFYVNGDNNLENLRRPDQTWKVRLIEEEFKRLMFDVQDV